jgi:hypothetical protein
MSKLLVGVFSVLSACSACSGATLAPQQVQGINEGVCALEHYATDSACRKPETFVTCVTDTASACGITAQSVESIFASHRKAEIAEGMVPPVQPVMMDAGK